MLKFKKGTPQRILDVANGMRDMLLHHDHGWGILCLLAAALVLSLLAGLRHDSGGGIFLEGEIATRNVVADRNMLVEDFQATQARRDQAMAAQPLIFDLDRQSIARFRTDTLTVLEKLNLGASSPDFAAIAESFNLEHGSSLEPQTFELLADLDVQAYLLNVVLPWAEAYLNEGVVPDMRLLSSVQNSAFVRDISTGTEVLRTQAEGLHDLRSLMVAVGQRLRAENQLSPEAQNAIQELLTYLILPSLALNQDATNQRNTELLRAIEPVYYQLQRGEIVVRAGDRVTHEQQIKMQSLYSRGEGGLDPHVSLGVFLLCAMIMLGLFMTPSGSKGTILHTRDQVFIALLVLFFGLAAWGLSRMMFSMGLDSGSALAFAFPVAAGAGLAALIFSAKRYCAVGLLLSAFATILFQGGFGLFLFYFLSAMFNTWLILRAQNRQDVVLSGIPLLAWIVVSGVAASWLDGGAGNWLYLSLALVANSLLSVLLLFALSPILETTMGFTTRFRLMELMNLEQPLLQNLMMSTPGTYHHSLLVSYLVEAGAGAVGANSLLCKVGALYHDIGKLSRPEYFVENQFGGPNPHDKLSPSMSALVLGSHVKHGVELAAEYKLGREISEIIAQHHGSRAIMFFYQKAINLGENPRLEDYSYPGPRPQSKEAAIVMIADAVEASSRALVDPTPARIKAHVDTIIKSIYAEGQLDESELAFKDINKLADSFVRILTGLFHKRISYPDKTNPKNGVCVPENREAKTQSVQRQTMSEQLAGVRQQGLPARFLTPGGQK